MTKEKEEKQRNGRYGEEGRQGGKKEGNRGRWREKDGDG